MNDIHVRKDKDVAICSFDEREQQYNTSGAASPKPS